jgi:hypothetical protein
VSHVDQCDVIGAEARSRLSWLAARARASSPRPFRAVKGALGSTEAGYFEFPEKRSDRSQTGRADGNSWLDERPYHGIGTGN